MVKSHIPREVTLLGEKHGGSKEADLEKIISNPMVWVPVHGMNGSV
jgi:hypothetical protein